MARPGQPEGFFAAPDLVRDEVVTRGVQAAGDVGQTHGDLYEQADSSLRAAVLDHALVHLKATAEKLLSTVLREYLHIHTVLDCIGASFSVFLCLTDSAVKVCFG